MNTKEKLENAKKRKHETIEVYDEKLEDVERKKQFAIDAYDRDIAKLEAELDKPKLKPVHGSKMVDKTSGERRIALYDSGYGLRAYKPDGTTGYPADDLCYEVLDETIFDDLKAMSEPLEKFEVLAGETTNDSDKFAFKANYDGKHIWLEVGNGGHYFEVGDVVLIHRKLGGLIAWARKKQND